MYDKYYFMFTFVSNSPKIGMPFFLKSCSWPTIFPFMRFFIKINNKPIGCSSSFSSKQLKKQHKCC